MCEVIRSGVQCSAWLLFWGYWRDGSMYMSKRLMRRTGVMEAYEHALDALNWRYGKLWAIVWYTDFDDEDLVV